MIIIDKWPGLVTNASPYSLPPGAAATQVNLQVLAPGVLAVRPGATTASFASHTGSTLAIRSTLRYPQEAVIYQNAAGGVFVARGPA
jgi:hypothetical protein